MKRVILLLIVIFSISTHAQISAYINGKEIKNGATISKNDLATLQVSFKKPKEVTIYSGFSNLYVEFSDNSKAYMCHWEIRKTGYTAMEDFLKNTSPQKKFSVFEGEEFVNRGNNPLQWILDEANGLEKKKSIRVEIGFLVKEETGYKEYGPKVQLLESIYFNVPIWDTKDLFLPYLDVKMDKSNIAESIELMSLGRINNSEDREMGYSILHNDMLYKIVAFDKTDHPGLNTDELAKDFIYAATYETNQDKLKSNHQYDAKKYALPWDNICRFHELLKLQNLSYAINKNVKSADLMSLYQKVDFGKMKGYAFQSGVAELSDGKVKNDAGQFKIYILNHPTNPNLTIMLCNVTAKTANTAQEIDSFMQTILKSIKQ